VAALRTDNLHDLPLLLYEIFQDAGNVSIALILFAAVLGHLHVICVNAFHIL